MPNPDVRLLPWSDAQGKGCLLITDNDAPGPVSRVADQVEAVQLGMGQELIGHAEEILGDPRADPGQVRYLAARLTEALGDAVRVAVSRGARAGRG
ncbi:hypothetical protein OHA98_06150 [Streptomyces sp. NBC_00654]|uniref:hypothetical protein n=1 Tax=Streptomyces sp. NBC_00654 TaxID=2975799 RepID=UPI0022586DDE|nr:hypothetical protein [Streptomyces sp. NBC_00654]MCX4964404.1 hypothetical protein [Streptomyces sp. NBC_00654]